MSRPIRTAGATLASSLLGLLILGLGTAQAQTEVLTINATVSSRAELTLAPTTINFPDASPTATPIVPADSTVSVTARVRTTGTPTLRVIANGDLTSGGDTIAASQVSWTAAPAPFIAGTMNTSTAQDAATFGIGSGEYTGTYTFSMVNDWSYAVGAYTTTATYTLTAP